MVVKEIAPTFLLKQLDANIELNTSILPDFVGVIQFNQIEHLLLKAVYRL